MLTPKEILRYKFKKYVQDLYKQNHKTLMNEMKYLNKEGDILLSWTGSPNVFKKTHDGSFSQTIDSTKSQRKSKPDIL